MLETVSPRSYPPTAAHQDAPSVSQGLAAACAEVSPSIRLVPKSEPVNTLIQEGLSADYRGEKPDYTPSGIVDRQLWPLVLVEVIGVEEEGATYANFTECEKL